LEGHVDGCWKKKRGDQRGNKTRRDRRDEECKTKNEPFNQVRAALVLGASK